jgi:hypothetical protein
MTFSARRRRARVPLLVAALLGVARSASGQGVVLEIRPRVGDTLHLRLDQQTELSGKRRGPGGETTTSSVITTMRIFSRAIVERSAASGTVVRAVTDSVRLTTTDPRALGLTDDAQKRLEGRSVQLRISPDGTIALAEAPSSGPTQLSDLVSLMPASFPRGPVDVGYSWGREMPLPGGDKLSPGSAAPGWLHAKFRLDSLSRRGTAAYVSMRGEMDADPDARSSSGAGQSPVLEKGVVRGWMVVDRRRGWLTESQFTIVMHSVVQLPGGSDTIMRFETRVTQRMKTVDRR